jgi:septin family protein
MILLVGEPGSGRTSMINTISSQTPKKYIGQFLSDDDDQVRTVLHEIVTHFGSFQPIPTMNQLSQKLVSILDEEKGPLPLIALDYPSRATDINIFLSRISPILSRLRAMIIVTITESQLLELDL